MVGQQEKPVPASEKPSFFGLPSGWSSLSKVGARFWGGVLFGAGLGAMAGLFVAALMADSELPSKTAWIVGLPSLAFVLLGRSIADRAVRRDEQKSQGP